MWGYILLDEKDEMLISFSDDMLSEKRRRGRFQAPETFRILGCDHW